MLIIHLAPPHTYKVFEQYSKVSCDMISIADFELRTHPGTFFFDARTIPVIERGGIRDVTFQTRWAVKGIN